MRDVGEQVDEHDQIAKTSVTACTTGKSRWKIELIISWPTPGQGEDLLDHERPADEEADVDAEHGDGRDRPRCGARGG